MNSTAKRALYDNLEKDEVLAIAVDDAVRGSRQDDWRGNSFKIKRVRNAIRAAIETARMRAGSNGIPATTLTIRPAFEPYNGSQSPESIEDQVERILTLVRNQNEY